MLSKLKGNTFLAGTAVFLISNILNAAIPFALLPVLTRYLGPEQYGEVAIFQTLLGALASFIGLSMQAAAGRKYYDGNLSQHELKDFIGSCMQILLVTSVITLVCLIGLSGRLSEWFGLAPRWIFLAVIVTASNIIVRIRLTQWQVRKEAKRYGILQVSQSVLNLALSLLLVVIFLQGPGGRISGQALTVGVFALIALWLLKRDGLLKFFVWRPAYLAEALKFGVPLIPHVAGIFLLASVDRFVINSQLGIAQAGIYMVAVQFGMALSLVFDAINKAYVPWLYERLKRDNEKEKIQIVRYTYAWYLFILCGAGLAFMIGPWIVTFVAGEDYAGAGDVVGWLALGQVFGGMYHMQTSYVFFSKRTGLLSIVTMFSGTVNVALLFLLIDSFELEGAAYAFCIAMAIRFFFTWCVSQKRHPMPWFKLVTQS